MGIVLNRKGMSKKFIRKLLVIAAGAGFLLLLSQHNAEAWSLGVTGLDGLMQTFEDGVPRCGLLFALVGGAGITLAKFENHFNSFFSSYINYFVTAGVFGSLATLLATVGVVG